ncbi:retrovirus-related pol polyprotein from transposon 17.6 [Tanacetum coccineum]
MQTSPEPNTPYDPDLRKLLQKFRDVFVVPTELPAQRSCDHRIPLKDSSTVINIRPYRYPPNQKDMIWQMVNELLDARVVRHSQSPFSSLVVMVKKKDVIEELIDELNGAQVFSKLDLSLGVATDPRKIEAMKAWPVPTNIKKLRGFLGLTGYYRIFIQGYANISQSLTILLKKNAFLWNLEAQTAFERLKQAMTKASILALPKFNKEFTIETNASGYGIGAVLQQRGNPIAFLSITLASKHQSMSAYKKELLDVVLALQKW